MSTTSTKPEKGNLSFHLNNSKSDNREFATSQARKLGIGVKFSDSDETFFFYGEEEAIYGKHMLAYNYAEPKISAGKAVSLRKVQNILYEQKNVDLLEDLYLAKWLMEAENMVFEITEDMVPNKSSFRTAPFRFKDKNVAQNAFNFIKATGMNPVGQRYEPCNFWLEPRSKLKIRREKIHPITKKTKELGIGSTAEESDFYGQNNIQMSKFNVLSKKKSHEEVAIFTRKLVEKLKESLGDDYDFKISPKGLGFKYSMKLVNTQTNAQTIEAENPKEETREKQEDLVNMFTPEMWRHIFAQAPREIVDEFFGGSEDEKYKKILEQIQSEYVLVNKNNPMIPGIKAMKPEDVKDISDFMS